MDASRHYPGLTAARIHARAAALARFDAWQEAHPPELAPEAALAAADALYDLLPADARRRPVDPTGVEAMHRALSVLGRRPTPSP